MAIKKTLNEMPDIAISLLILFAILMIGGLFMYKTSDVSTSIITNTTQQGELNDRADSFNTTGDELVSVVDVVVSLIVIFVLFAIIWYVVSKLRSKGSSGL